MNTDDTDKLETKQNIYHEEHEGHEDINLSGTN